MEHWALLEVFARLRAAELQQRGSQPVAPATPGFWSAWRRRLAKGLVGLGLRLDADASLAAIGSIDTTPQLNGSDA